VHPQPANAEPATHPHQAAARSDVTATAGYARAAAPGAPAGSRSSAATFAPGHAGGLAAIAMPDLLTIRRQPERGARPERAGALASGFGAVEVIRPSTASAPNLSAPAAADPRLPGAPRRENRAGSPRPGERTDQPAVPQTAPRAYLPAPPPVSVRRTPAEVVRNPAAMPAAGGAGAPPVPAVALGGYAASGQTTGEPAGSGSAGTTSFAGSAAGGVVARRTLLDSTAELFRSMGPTGSSNLRRYDQPGGSPVSDHLPATVGDRSVRRFVDSSVSAVAPPNNVAPPDFGNGRELDDLVDRVVDRIEQRVVDELERRGERHNRGAF
jgi:hypothetical protein